MREIKFRVRDGLGGKILGYEYFNTCLNSGYYYINLSELKEGETEDELICHSNYHKPPMLMPSGFNKLHRELCTGIKDKNGTEIYEGDKIKGHTRYDSSVEIEGIIVFVDQMFSVKQEQGNKTIYTPLFHMYKPEVIGNIHTQDGGQEG